MQKKYNKKLKKLVAVVLVMMFCLAGCSQKAVSSEITSSVQNETVTETETVSLSPKDMTVEEMLKHIKLYGEEVSLPCKVSELPKTVTLGDGYTMSDGGAVCDLLHNGEKIGAIHLDKMKSDGFKQINMSTGYENEIIYGMTLHASADGVDCFDIVGVTGHDTKEDILKKLGERSNQAENDYTYECTNNGKIYELAFIYDTDDLMGLCIIGITDEREKETTR